MDEIKTRRRKQKKPLTYIVLQIEAKQAEEWGYSNRWIKMDIEDLYLQGLPRHTDQKSFTDQELINAVTQYMRLSESFLEGYQVKRPNKVPEMMLVTKE